MFIQTLLIGDLNEDVFMTLITHDFNYFDSNLIILTAINKFREPQLSIKFHLIVKII